MIGSTSPRAAPARLRVPGVYYEPRPRAPEAPSVRTDIAGFVGFEPRVRATPSGSRLLGTPVAAAGAFRVVVDAFALASGPVVGTVPTATLSLSTGPSLPLTLDGQSLAYAVVVADDAGVPTLVGVSGARSDGAIAAAPSDDAVASAVLARFGAARPWVRIADVTARREEGLVWLDAAPRLAAADGKLTPTPGLVGHEFEAQVTAFQLVVGGVRAQVPGGMMTLSSDPVSIPIKDLESVTFALAVALQGASLVPFVAAGPAATANAFAPPDDDSVAAALAVPGPWTRIADVHVQRKGGQLFQTTHPALALTRCDDWRDFLLAFGDPVADGTLLADAARAYFTNGGSRLYVATVERPQFEDDDGLDSAREAMIGVMGASESQATGLERLLLVEEVSVVDAPDLHARHVSASETSVDLPAREREACFLPCSEVRGPVGKVRATAVVEEGDPLFADPDAVFDTQRRMLLRCVPERWRAFLLLTPPRTLDDGRYRPPSPDEADAWRDRFSGLAEPEELSCAGLFYPWLLAQDRVDAPVRELPPTAYVAGVIARRDLARGPHVAPANETLRGVVGVTWPIDDVIHGRLYQPEPSASGLDRPAVNVLRPFAGYGVQAWGARTLSTERWLRFLPVRRCLSAIERRAKVALEPAVFEPNTPLLWLEVVRLLMDVLQPVFESGALRGDLPEQSFYVRCDASSNPPESVEAGRLVCEVGVAIAAPAEFLVFRVGRREGVVEVVE